MDFGLSGLRTVYDMTKASRMTLGKSAIDGESPVSESGSQPAGPRVLRDT